jgi:hypothetical protein
MRLILLKINQKKLLFTCKVYVNNYVIADFDFFYKMEPYRPRLAIIKVSKKC